MSAPQYFSEASPSTAQRGTPALSVSFLRVRRAEADGGSRDSLQCVDTMARIIIIAHYSVTEDDQSGQVPGAGSA